MTCCQLKVPKGAFHCVVCCNTFGQLVWFDVHQKGWHRRKVCFIPDGLVEDRWGVWRTPDDKAALEGRIDAMKEARRK